MDNILFEGNIYESVLLIQVPDELQNNINFVSFIPGDCLMNSYKAAKLIEGITIVEGYLITLFEAELPECVGHVWNELDGKYFDVTIELKKHDKKIIANRYFIVDKYTVTDIKTEKRKKGGVGFDSFLSNDFETHLVFKTNVKSKELKVRDQVRNIYKVENENSDNDNSSN